MLKNSVLQHKGAQRFAKKKELRGQVVLSGGLPEDEFSILGSVNPARFDGGCSGPTKFFPGRELREILPRRGQHAKPGGAIKVKLLLLPGEQADRHMGKHAVMLTDH